MRSSCSGTAAWADTASPGSSSPHWPGTSRPGGFASTLVCWAHAEDGEWSEPLREWLAGSGCNAFDRWVAHYAEEGLSAFSTGGVVLRRRPGDGDSWFAAVDAETGPTGSGSEQLLRILAAHDFGGDLRGARLEWRGGSYRAEHLALALEEGIGLELSVEPATLPALFDLNGSRPVRELTGAEAALPTIRRLLEAGFVERA
jgi:hypothetical protein